MDERWEMTHNAVMTVLAKKIRTNAARVACGKSGFTLVELLVATSIAALLSTLTWTILIENTKGNIRAEFKRRIHEDWNQATTLIQSEISMSDLITSDNVTAESIPDEQCQLLQDSNARLKLRLHLVGTLPEIIYGTRTIGSLPDSEAYQWIGNPEHGVLIRCGPEREIGQDGKIQYRQGTYQESIVLDNLDLSQSDGLDINQSTDSEKLVEFSLSMNETMGNNPSERIRTKTLSSSGVSRINDVQHIPSESSICQTICQSEDTDCGHGVKTLLASDPRFYIAPMESRVFGTKTICTNRSLESNDGIEGSNTNYVMDGNPSPTRSNSEGVTIQGGEGRNILLGTTSADTLRGGPDHDGLIGRGGTDTLEGHGGNDNFVPWPSANEETSSVSIDGGEGFDRVYLNSDESSYSLINCTSRSCEVNSNSNGELDLSNVEMLVFRTSSKRI